MTLDPAVAAVRVAVRRELADVRGQPVLVACSGGADSLALLAATVFEARRPEWHVVGVTVDHGLQEDSAQRAEAVVAQMAALGADETMGITVTVDAPGLGVEAAARKARYAALGQASASLGSSVVLLGHTLDDQAETVLMGLARGSGGRSIAGMRRTFDDFRRPLLDLTRQQTRTACRAEGVEWWEDPHNSDPRFLRSRVRHTALPVLESVLGPGVATTLARTADQLRADMDALDDLATAALHEVAVGDEGLSVEATAALPAAIRTRVLRAAALNAGAPASELFHTHVTGMDRLLTDWHGQQGIDLPGAIRLARQGGVLRFVGRT